VRSPRRIGRSTVGRRTKVLRVYRVLVTRTGGYLGGPQLGCDVEFWSVARVDRSAPEHGEPVPAGTWVAARPNRWADLVTPQEQEVVPRPVDGRTMPRLSTITRPHVLSVTHPVDVVYTWVDGSDPDWILRKAAAHDDHVTRAQVLHDLAANDSRFTSRDELRYSLRSLDMYADWVRHIYLVTDDQVPPWLATDNDRLTVVSHRELFEDRGQLPTFNSHAIESQLHHINGLSEHYLYLNDDVFFGRPVSSSLFFHGNGLAIFALSKAKVGLGRPCGDDMPVMSAAKNNRDLLAERFGVTVTNKFQHVPHAQRRSVMFDLEREFADDFKRTACAQFRSHQDISPASSLGHYYGYITGRAVPGSLRYFYADIARDDTAERLQSLLQYRDYDVFCLNDHDSSTADAAEQAKVLADFLDSYYPMPSSFESVP
jgi:Stealth protein CR2, conserved region 2/Stealth protein CR3, conserved region 3/Stealth protein CR4, conserved region 4/Stealth protein CR1, conserved region 1